MGDALLAVHRSYVAAIKPALGQIHGLAHITGGGLHVSVTGGPVTLVRAATDIAGTVELHTMSMENDMMQMRKVESFPVSPDQPLVLERGGNHLMLFGVQSLQIGDQVDVVLTFTDESGTEQDIVTQAEVVPPAG